MKTLTWPQNVGNRILVFKYISGAPSRAEGPRSGAPYLRKYGNP